MRFQRRRSEAPFEDGPRRYAKRSYAQSRLEFEAVDKTPTYDLVVIDEAHHIFRIEKLRAHAQPFVDSSATSRFLLLSDVSQANRSDINAIPFSVARTNYLSGKFN